MNIEIPEFCIVVLIGASGSGKSTFAGRFFNEEEILSSDRFRWMITGNEANQESSKDAFSILHLTLAFRLKRRLLCVVDATNTTPASRESIFAIAKKYNTEVYAFVFDFSFEECYLRNLQRARVVPDYVIQKQIDDIQSYNLDEEHFRSIITFHSIEELNSCDITRRKMFSNKTDVTMVDMIGDIHGCFVELIELVEQLGYTISKKPEGSFYTYSISHPENRRLVFLGDLIDRGPSVGEVVHFVYNVCQEGNAFCLPGNHENKFLRHLYNHKEKATPEIEASIQSIKKLPNGFVDKLHTFIYRLHHHYLFDGGKLVVAHAGLPEYFHGRDSKKIRDFALYGDTNGERDANGFPIRRNWAKDYSGEALVVYGHTPVREPHWENNTVNIDTGCVFGGKLTALRYPERKMYFVPAKKIYYSRVSWRTG
jgi:protein phosphatase